MAQQIFRGRDNDVTYVRANADGRLAATAFVQNFLNSGERRTGGAELEHEAIARRVEQTPAMLRGDNVEAMTQRFDFACGVALVALRHCREANDVDRHDRRQPDCPLFAVVCHS